MDTLSPRELVRNAAAVFSGCHGAVTRRARQAGCSRQALYDQARKLERRLQAPAPRPSTPPVEVAVPAPADRIDLPAQQRLAVTAFAMGISTRQIEDLLRVLLGEQAPDHSTIGRWVADAAEKAKAILGPLDAACIPEVQTLAVDEVFFGGGRPWSGSSRRA